MLRGVGAMTEWQWGRLVQLYLFFPQGCRLFLSARYWLYRKLRISTVMRRKRTTINYVPLYFTVGLLELITHKGSVAESGLRRRS